MEQPKSSERNYMWAGFFTLLTSFVLVFSFPYLQEKIPFLRENLKTYALLDSVVKGGPKAEVVDTFQAKIDSLKRTGAPSTELDSLLKIRAYRGGPGLKKFFIALDASKKGKTRLRVAYFGDSMTEGDLVVGTLRTLLQDQFGGTGVGFVPITSATAKFRRTIKHDFSQNWTYKSYIQKKVKTDTLFDFGISGEYFLAQSQPASATYKATKEYGSSRELSEIYLFYGVNKKDTAPQSENKVKIHADNYDSTYVMDGTARVNKIKVFGGSTQILEAAFSMSARVPVYGFSFESDGGIHVDNYSIRGNSGLPITGIPGSVMQGFDRHMSYDLIILHYGLNVVSKDSVDYSWYSQGFYRMVKYVKDMFPESAVLVVGLSDMAGNVKGKLRTLPGVPQVNDIQRNVAIQLETGFFSLYDKMGGENSIIQWHKDKLAGDDYTHVNGSGAARIGRWIFDYLMEEYNNWKSGGEEPPAKKPEEADNG